MVGRDVPQAGSRGLLMSIRTGHSGRHGGAPFLHASQCRSLLSQCPTWGCTRGGAAACYWQWQGWRPAGLASRPNPAKSRESKSRVRPAHLRGLGALAVREQAARRHGASTGHVAQSPTVAGMGSLLGSWCYRTGARVPSA
jgi:hypothetical protein